MKHFDPTAAARDRLNADSRRNTGSGLLQSPAPALTTVRMIRPSRRNNYTGAKGKVAKRIFKVITKAGKNKLKKNLNRNIFFLIYY
jgi:hypothetical protein